MSIADKIWDALAQVIKMNEQVIRLSVQVKELATEMREIDKRLVRMETMLELALAGKVPAPDAAAQRRLPPKGTRD
jgi:ABC-type transport system involved in Fe-S cluster assembly fused permease/ATPase subunit